MQTSPLDSLETLLPARLLRVVKRDTPIPTIAARAAALKKEQPSLVRSDIGQISELDPSLEVLYGPPVGMEELRKVLAETWNITLGLRERPLEGLPDGLKPEHVAVCTGAAEGLTLLFAMLAHEKVVGLPRGHWENYSNGVDMAGGRSVLVDFFDAEGQLNIEGLRHQLQSQDIRLLVVNFPCNPTGAVLTDAEVHALGKLLEETNTLAIADEVYWRLRYDGAPPNSLLRAAPGHVVVVSSASKEYLLPGARVGYVISTRARFTDGALRKLIRANTASPNVPGQQRLLSLMKDELVFLKRGEAPPLLTRVRDEMALRKARLVEILDKHGFTMVGRPGHVPMGTIFLMAGLPAWWKGSDMAFVEKALETATVSVIPGSAFALERCVRFSFGGMTTAAIEQLDVNLARMRALVEG